jgi:Ca2+-binding RTX toxin-like protein
MSNNKLQQALQIATSSLQSFAQETHFWQNFELAFGQDYDRSQAEAIRLSALNGEFMLPIRVIQDRSMGLAAGAFAAATNTIYLRDSVVKNGTVNLISSIIIEELGHAIDSQVNEVESPGDEGAIFRLLVDGENIPTDLLAELKAEDDWGIIWVDGQELTVEMANIMGTAGADSLSGDTDINNFNDFIDGLGGDDLLDGGLGDDVLIGGLGNDLSNGGDSNDTISDFEGLNTLNGGNGNDNITTSSGNANIVDGGSGLDVLYLDYYTGSTYAGPTTAANITFTASGIGSGTNSIQNIETLFFLGDGSNDFIDASLTSIITRLNGDDGNDTLFGGSDLDNLEGGFGNDQLNGNGGDDYLSDTNGVNILNGGSGNDTLLSNEISTIDGGDGLDTLSLYYGDGYGNANIAANITFTASGIGTGTNSIQNIELLNFNTNPNFGGGGGFRAAIAAVAAVDPTSDDFIDASLTSIELNLAGDSGNDTFLGGSANDLLRGGNGNDSIVAGAGNDNIGGQIFFAETSFSAASFTSSFSVNEDGNDTFSGGIGNDSLFGGSGDDSLFGDDGDDALYGGDGNDSIFGGAGDDLLNGGSGNSTLAGASGNDTYSISGYSSTDSVVINDSSGIDLLSISSTFDLLTSFSKAGTTLLVDLNGDQVLNAAEDISILNFFNSSGNVGSGFIETVGNLTGADIINRFAAAPISAADFNGDGRSDILWRNTNSGEAYIYQVNGFAVPSEGSVRTVSSDWQIAGTGDFNGDNKSDILWRNSNSGEAYIYQMNGLAVASEGSVRTVSSDWQIAGTGDFNGDNKSDILWRNSNSGEAYIYQMNGLAVVNEGSVRTVSNDWKIAGTGDFNGDGNSDILWRNTNSGSTYAYLMNGTSVVGEGEVRQVATDWIIEGIDDFNNDSKSDILWRNTNSGEAYIYQMNGVNVSLEGSIGTGPVGSGWNIAGTGDYNGDSKADVLWRNNDGTVYGWSMDGLTRLGEGSIRQVDNSWQIAAPTI